MKTQQQKVTVTTIRNNKVEQFKGIVVGETDTHYKVSHNDNELGELFPKQSKMCWCVLED